jgi:hypothetical protein
VAQFYELTRKSLNWQFLLSDHFAPGIIRDLRR